jgi:hypothetical protein
MTGTIIRKDDETLAEFASTLSCVSGRTKSRHPERLVVPTGR